jgi:hypothetical protein
MPLPTVKYPSYTIVVPSTQQLAKFRPFTVAEEKILLMGAASGELKDISNSIVEVLEACFYNQLKVSDLPSFDIEYLFLSLRARSVNEKIELSYTPQNCRENEGNPCKKSVKLTIDIDKVKVQQLNSDGSYSVYDPKGNTANGKKLILDEGLGITIMYPNMQKLTKSYSSKTEMEQIEQLIASCVTSVFDEENVYTDFSLKEMVDWYNTLTSAQREPIIDFIKNMPVMRYEINYKCNKCGMEDKIVFEGLQSFL